MNAYRTTLQNGTGRPEGLELLRIIDEGVAGDTGEQFFRSLVVSLARALDVANAFACKFSDDRGLGHVFAEWVDDHLLESPQPFPIPGSPCELVLNGEIVAFEDSVAERYPCIELGGAQSYLAIPLKNRAGKVLGHLAAIDVRPRQWQEADHGILRIFAARAAAEIERREFEMELEEARRVAEQANRAKSQFLAHMSHEIRTPLNAMFGYAQLLARASDLPAVHARAAEQILQSGEHLLGLVNEVLDITRIEAGRVEINLESIALHRCIEHVVDVARLRMRQAGLLFTFEPPAYWPTRLLLDERKLRQVLLNLLNNAAQYTPQGSVEFRVEIEADSRGDRHRLRFLVRDTGIGIAADDSARVFEPFYRTEAGWHLSAGSGLGLSIVRRLVELMGGRVAVESVPGKGSTFRVELEAATAQPAPVAALAARRFLGYSGPRRRILVADADSESCAILESLLCGLGFELRTVQDGESALAEALRGTADLILLDTDLPGMDGFELMRRLRAEPRRVATPIVVMSASAFESTRTRAAAEGGIAFLPKPLHFDLLIEAVGGALALDWIAGYGETPAVVTSAMQGQTPALEHRTRETMLGFARRGDIEGIQGQLAELAREGGVPAEVLAALKRLSERYDMKGLREYLGACEA